MSSTAIKVENLGKSYTIQHKQGGYVALRDIITNTLRNPLKFIQNQQSKQEIFWALKDVSFELKKGEVLGVIGRNGAGKSTLLKLLSQITAPTTGKISINGRVASLLEVGTGFHPELTGRENIYLSGTILGMKRREIQQQFDQIVDFAGVEQFLDTPVKRYSSGMYVRLGFSIAAHLNPDILLVDEVLAVGDAEFQKKCLNKMDNVAKQGRTVLFVSHNLNAVKSLCNTTILLDRGQKVTQAITSKVLTQYNQIAQEQTILEHNIHNNIITKVRISSSLTSLITPASGTPLYITVSFSHTTYITQPVLGLVIKDSFNTPLLGVNNHHYQQYFSNSSIKSGNMTVKIPDIPFLPGLYSLDLYLGGKQGDIAIIKDQITFEITNNKQQAIATNLNLGINKIALYNLKWFINE